MISWPKIFVDPSIAQYAAKEMERFEQKCQQLLVDSRPKAGGDETTIDFQLLNMFGRVTIFLVPFSQLVNMQSMQIQSI